MYSEYWLIARISVISFLYSSFFLPPVVYATVAYLSDLRISSDTRNCYSNLVPIIAGFARENAKRWKNRR